MIGVLSCPKITFNKPLIITCLHINLYLQFPHLFPLALLTAVHVYRDGVLVGADHSLHVVLFKGRGKVLEGEGPIL